MALSKDSVELSIHILKRINQEANVVRYEINDRTNSYSDTGKIFCVDEKTDKGYESIFTNIENMTEEQLKLWKRLKNEIPNSSFSNQLKDKNITCIGWF